MNDRSKCLMAVGVIAGISLAAGLVIGWKLGKADQRKSEVRDQRTEIRNQRSEDRGQKSETRGQGAARFPAGVFPAAGGTNIALRPGRSTNAIKRIPPRTTGQASPVASAATNPAYQQAQNAPEVKQAQEALVAAHKRAADVMEKAMKENYGGISFDAFHKVRDLPEVKQARAAIAEAELKYNTALQKALRQSGNQP